MMDRSAIVITLLALIWIALLGVVAQLKAIADKIEGSKLRKLTQPES
jgi:hypothetical protein